MGDAKAPATDWSEAVSDAARHVEERLGAQALAENNGPRSRRGHVPAALVVLLLLVAANVWLAVRPAPASDPMFYARQNRAWTLADAADVVEDFRFASGRLPTPDEVAGELGVVVSYRPRPGGYSLALLDEGPPLSYDSALPLEDWLAATVGGDGA